MRVANKLTPEPKRKMTKNKPKHKSEQFQDKTLQLKRSQEALHGFAQESTRTMLVPAQQDLKKIRQGF